MLGAEDNDGELDFDGADDKVGKLVLVGALLLLGTEDSDGELDFDG